MPQLRMAEEMTHSLSLDASSSHPPTSPSPLPPSPSPSSPLPATGLYEELVQSLREELFSVQREGGGEGGAEGGEEGGGEIGRAHV